MIGCKAARQYQSVTIDLVKEDVEEVVNSLGDISDYGALDERILTPQEKATVGAIHYVSKGKNYGISDVVVVEKQKTIKAKLKTADRI